MKKSNNAFYVFVLGLLIIAGGITSCGSGSDEEAEPTISSISPSTVTTGDEITISGTNLSNASVAIDFTTQTVTSNSSTSLKMRVLGSSFQLGSADVVVTNSVGSATSSINIAAYGVVINSILPATVGVGDEITVTGKGLTNASVRVYGINVTVTDNTDTSLKTTIPTSGVPSNVGQVAVEVATELGIIIGTVIVVNKSFRLRIPFEDAGNLHGYVADQANRTSPMADLYRRDWLVAGFDTIQPVAMLLITFVKMYFVILNF